MPSGKSYEPLVLPAYLWRETLVYLQILQVAFWYVVFRRRGGWAGGTVVGVWVIFNSAITMGMYRRARGDGYCNRVRYQNEDDSP